MGMQRDWQYSLIINGRNMCKNVGRGCASEESKIQETETFYNKMHKLIGKNIIYEILLIGDMNARVGITPI